MKGKKDLMVKDYMLNKVNDNIKETIVIIKLEGTRILIDADKKISRCDINNVRCQRLWYILSTSIFRRRGLW